jgi:NosR/NirI family nitrous oxide reductase transcriptional regulator
MIVRLRFAIPVILSALLASAARAVERFPPPDFTDHKLPATHVPEPSSLVWEYVDVALLIFALGLASYLALVRRSRRGVFLLTIASLAWFGFWRQGCICPIGAIQNVSLALFDPSYAIPLSVVAFFALPLLVTLFFGRTFCAAICPLGAIQELTLLQPVRVAPWLEHSLGLIPYIYLGAAILFAATGTAFVICQYDPFVGFFRLSGSVNMLVFGGCLLLIGLFVGRPYCRYLCPLGAVFRLLAPLSKWHVRIPPDDCIRCRLCEDACPYGAIRPPTVELPVAARRQGRRRLAVTLVLFPALIVAGTWLGYQLGGPLSRWDFDSRLAEQLRLEETGKVQDATDASDAFRNTGRPARELYQEVLAQRRRFALAGAGLGAWVGLVVGAKLLQLSIRRRRTEYEPDRSRCVSCGRCFWYCPQEQVRQGLISLETAGDETHEKALTI